MSDDKLLDARNRASQAAFLLENELLVEGFNSLVDAYTKALFATRPDDQQAREKLYLAVNVVGKLKEHLQSIIANGKLADAELKAMIEEQERKKRFRVFG